MDFASRISEASVIDFQPFIFENGQSRLFVFSIVSTGDYAFIR